MIIREVKNAHDETSVPPIARRLHEPQGEFSGEADEVIVASLRARGGQETREKTEQALTLVMMSTD